jgi:hypothetical protein
VADTDLFRTGTGRLDVARAVTQTVTVDEAAAPLSFGTAAWPHEDDEPVTRELTYRNSGESDVTLTLGLETAAPDGLFALGAGTVTVPAGGTATVPVVADTRRGGDASGDFTVVVTATGDDGQRIRTAGTVHREREMHQVTVDVTGLDGRPEDDWWGFVYSFETGRHTGFEPDGGTATVRAPGGDSLIYLVSSDGETEETLPTDVTGFAHSLRLHEDVTVSFDAREAREVAPSVFDATARQTVESFGVGYDDYSYGYLTRTPADTRLRTLAAGPELPGRRFGGSVGASWLSADENTEYHAGWRSDHGFFTGTDRHLA